MSKFAWVTLATNDSYSLGALVLANSLKRAGTSHQLVVLITPGVSNAMRERLQSVFNVVEEVNVLDSQDSANLALLARPELGITFTKLHCWRLVQFEKCVFLDADTLVLQNSDELFEREELSAAPDVGWPDCFNSGVFVYRPNLDTYGNLIDFAVKQGSFDGGDQGLLNLFFSDWAHRDIAKHLPFIYNTCSTACYSYLPAFKKFGQNVKILHFIGTMKPWLQSFDSQSGQVNIPSGSEHVAQYLQLWWSIFFQHVHRDLTAEMAGIAGALSHVTLGAGKSPEQEAYEHQMRRQFWEAGNIDYMGKDSFDNIWARISKTIDNVPAAAAETSSTETTTAAAPAAAAPAAPKPAAEAPKKSATGQVKETVEEETVKIQERVITTKTPDGKTILTKITTLPGEEIEEIEEETTETIDGETKTNKTKSQVVKSPFPVSKLPNGKEIPIKGNMKEGDVVTDYDEETKTTIITKRLANGYEQSFSTITPEGNNKSWTKTFFDPVAVEGDEEEEEIEEYEEVETHGGGKKTTTETTAPAGAAKQPQATPAKAPAASKPQAAPAKTPAASKPQATPAQGATPAAAKKPGQTTVVKNIPHGKQEITTTVDKDGKETTKIHTMTDLPNEAEEYEEYEETHITEEAAKKRTTTTTTQKQGAPQPQKKQEVVPAKNTTTTVAVPSAKNPKDNVLARKVVSKGEEEIQITEEHTETEFSPSKKTTKTSQIIPSTGEKLDPKGKTTVTQVVVPGSQSTVVTKSNEQDGKQIVVKKGPSGTQNISKTTNADGSTKVQVTTTVNPEELHIEETETTNIIGDKTITTTRTEVPIPGKKIVTQLPAKKVEGAGTKTKTTTTTTTMPVGQDRKTTTTKRVDKGTEVTVKTETKDGKTRLESRTQFDPIYHPAVSDEEEVEEYEEETQTFAPVKTKTTTTSRVPAATDGSKKKPDAASSDSSAAAPKKTAPVKGAKK